MGGALFGDEGTGREATIDVARGLFLLRYVSGAAAGASPLAIVHPARGSEPFVEVISAPGVVSGFLSSPGECAVVRAEQPGRLMIKIKAESHSASLDASFRLEPVGAKSGGGAAIAGVSTESVAIHGAEKTLKLVAHVARRGDIEADFGLWIAGPNAPAAIEGIGIRGALPEGVRADVQVLVASNPPRWLDWTPVGSFAGTRGRAMPLAGLRVRLLGDAAARFVVCADALFLGSAIITKRGREIELVGSGAADPLVGLRLNLAPEARVKPENESFLPAAASGGVGSPQQNETRVRVFRAPSGA
jgi:hypothetical protein